MMSEQTIVSTNQYERGSEGTPSRFWALRGVEAVYVDPEGRIVITGVPMEPEEESDVLEHNCDFAGCGSVAHVLLRGQAERGFPVPPEDAPDVAELSGSALHDLYDQLVCALRTRKCESCGGPAQHVDPDGSAFCFECTEGDLVEYPGMGKGDASC